MMKKLCVLLLALLLAVAVFAACDAEESPEASDTTDTVTTSVHTTGETTAESTEPEPETTEPEKTEPETTRCAHVTGDWIVDVPAKIGVEGSRHKECTLCGEMMESETLAAIVPSEGLEFTSNTDGTCYVSGIGSCTDTDIVIPLVSPEGDTVRSIGSFAFILCDDLTSVTIGDSAWIIDDYAFYNCVNLTRIVISDSVTSIGEGVFYGCDSLENITVGENNAAYHSEGNCIIETMTRTLVAGCKSSVIPTDGSVARIGKCAFCGCRSLTSIEIPGSVTRIGDGAFVECDNLSSVTIGNGVTYIGQIAFMNCPKLASVTIPASVKVIKDGAFGCCDSLARITVDKNNTVYHSAGNCLVETATKTLIAGCQNSVIPTDGSVTKIGDRAFYRCYNLTSIVIPDSVTSIGVSAFCACIRLRSVTIGNSVTSIGSEAFWSCDSLTSVNIPTSVTNIGQSAFSGHVSSTSITVDENNTVYHSAGNCLIETATKTLIAGCKNSVIPTDGSVTSIADYAFSGCADLTSIKIPDSVIHIGEGAFHFCEKLSSIVIPASVTYIDIGAFDACDNLTNVYFTGTEEEWAAISIGQYNGSLMGATIHCNYVPQDEDNEDPDSVDVPGYILHYAATQSDDTGDEQYVDVVLGEDGYYHVGTADGPLLLANLLSASLFSSESVHNMAYQGMFVVDGKNYYDDILPYCNFASNATITSHCTVTAELKELLEKFVGVVGIEKDNPNQWLQLCVYYDAYGTGGVQLEDPIAGLAPFSAYDAVEGRENRVAYDHVIMPRGKYYKFVPERSGVYRIVSNSQYEVSGWVYTAKDHLQFEQYFVYSAEERDLLLNIGETGFDPTINCSMVVYMEAGKEYYINIAFYDPYKFDEFTFTVKYEAESLELFKAASPGYFTLAEDEEGNVLNDVIVAGGIDVALGDDGYYHELLKDGSLGSILYADFTMPTNIFPVSIMRLIEEGKFDFTMSMEDEYIKEVMDKHGAENTVEYLRKLWGDYYDGDGTPENPGYAALYKVEDCINGIWHGIGGEHTEEMRGYAEQIITGEAPELEGCVKVDARLAEILQKLMDKYTLEGVDHSWTKLCYYYDYIGPEA